MQRRSAQDDALRKFVIGAVNQDTLGVPGYCRLADSPDVLAAVGGLADIVSNATIQLMQNTPDGDVRVRNALSRFMDISPWSFGTRKDLISAIVWAMLTSASGTAFLLPVTRDGLLRDLIPMPGAQAMSPDEGQTVYISWRGQQYNPETVLQFRRWVDPDHPWQGLGLRISLLDVVNSLRQEQATKKGFMSDKWKPSVIVKVDALADEFSDPAGRRRLIDDYITGSSAGEPWIVPADLMDVQQVKPLSLSDLAIKDGVELDKKAVAALVGVTPFMLGVGTYSDSEHNHMIKTTATTIANIICQELTRKLLYATDLYFTMSTRRLYSYSTKELADVSSNLYVRGLMTGNEVRDWVGLSPREGLNELVILENYIPRDMIADQKKLTQGGVETVEPNRQQRQVRCIPQAFQTREAESDLYIEGYFAVFNSEYPLWDDVSEIIKPGAFTNSISGDIRALINHDTSLVLGRTKSGTLTLKQDERGLWGSVRINRDDVDAMNLYARVQRGDVDQCSFGFAIKSETFRDLGNGKYRWEIEEIDPLYEVSVCTFPAYEQTSVSARKRDFEEIEKRRLETWRAEMNKKLGGNP